MVKSGQLSAGDLSYHNLQQKMSTAARRGKFNKTKRGGGRSFSRVERGQDDGFWGEVLFFRSSLHLKEFNGGAAGGQGWIVVFRGRVVGRGRATSNQLQGSSSKTRPNSRSRGRVCYSNRDPEPEPCCPAKLEAFGFEDLRRCTSSERWNVS